MLYNAKGQVAQAFYANGAMTGNVYLGNRGWLRSVTTTRSGC